jgi:beta-galactosidase
MDTFDPHGGRAYAHRRADQTTAEFMDVGIGTEGGREIARLPVVEGEYDREESPRRVWDKFSPPNFGYPEAKGQTYQLTSEEYAVNEVAQYVRKLGAPNHCGGANWIFSDSTSGGRVACEVARASGEVDGVRLPKEAWYVCRTMFRDDPQVHLIGHWNYPAATKKTVYVTSNCEDVELFVNGKSLGHGQVSDRYLYTFPDVAWEPGEIKAVASNDRKLAATEIRRTVGAPAAVRLTPTLGPSGLQADGSDVALVDVEVVDAKGERCPTFQQRVDFDLVGPGIWRGGYNSGKTNSINNPFLNVECGINRVAIRSTPSAGPITLTAHCGSLKPATLTLTSQPLSRENGSTPTLPQLPPLAKLTKPAPSREDRPRRVEDATTRAFPLNPGDKKSAVGNYIKTFSYSGPTTAVSVQPNACDGARIYADRDFVFADLPAPLKGSDWVQTANADKLFSAVDLIELAATAESVVYIAHDDRLPRPDWLQRQFKPVEVSLVIGGKPMKLFERQVHTGESLTLGSNTENRSLKSCNMYLVFVTRLQPTQHAATGSGH